MPHVGKHSIGQPWPPCLPQPGRVSRSPDSAPFSWDPVGWCSHGRCHIEIAILLSRTQHLHLFEGLRIIWSPACVQRACHVSPGGLSGSPPIGKQKSLPCSQKGYDLCINGKASQVVKNPSANAGNRACVQSLNWEQQKRDRMGQKQNNVFSDFPAFVHPLPTMKTSWFQML